MSNGPHPDGAPHLAQPQATPGAGRGCLLGCGGLFAGGVVAAVAGASVWVGLAMILGSCAAIAAIASGQVAIDRRRGGLVALFVGMFSLLGTASAYQREHEREEVERRIEERTRAEEERAAAEAERVAAARAAAPTTIAAARAALGEARAAMTDGRFEDAVADADRAHALLADVLLLRPAVDGAAAANDDAITARSEASALVSAQTAIGRANAATDPAADADLLAWDADLATIAQTLTSASTSVRARLGDSIDAGLARVRGLRARHARDVARRQRDVDRVAQEVAEAQRDRIARDLDRAFIASGYEVESVAATGTHHTTLLVRYALCGRVWFDRNLADTAFLNRMESAGFTRVECRSYFQGVHVDL